MTDAVPQFTDARGLLYRPGLLDPDGARRLTAEALKGCDDGELYLQYRASESFGFDDGRLKTADYSTDAGFGLRGVSGEMTGFAHANDISEAAIRRAAETLTLLDPGTRQQKRLVRMPRRVEDYAWTPDGLVLAGEGSVLKAFDPQRGGDWETVADLSSHGLTGITRLSVSPRGDAVAVVAVPSAPGRGSDRPR